MRFLLLLISFLCFLNLAFGLKCYKCTTCCVAGGEQSCDEAKVQVCPGPGFGCGKVTISKDGVNHVSKTCIPNCQSSLHASQAFGQAADSSLACCFGDLCNGAESSRQNKLLFSAVVAYAVSKLFLWDRAWLFLLLVVCEFFCNFLFTDTTVCSLFFVTSC